MDAPQKKAGSMDGKMPHQLLLMVAKKKMAACLTPYPDAVQLVSAWALSTACLFLLFAVAYTLDHYHVPFPCSPCIELTDAEAAEVAAAGSAISIGMLWCAAPQAAAAALALLLPCRCRRVRRALAYLALTLAVVGHSMYARACLLLHAADPGDLFAGIMYTLATVVFAVVDLLCFLTLLLGREDRGVATDWSSSTWISS